MKGNHHVDVTVITLGTCILELLHKSTV